MFWFHQGTKAAAAQNVAKLLACLAVVGICIALIATNTRDWRRHVTAPRGVT